MESLHLRIAMSSRETPLDVVLDATQTQARLKIDVPGANLSAHHVESLFVPFGSIEYENRSGIRAAVGLYLCRQIVQLHNGRLEVSDGACPRSPMRRELSIIISSSTVREG
jgi:K+-sensing histidine kinase KdpD